MVEESTGSPPGIGRERNVLVLDLSKSMLAPLPEPQPGTPERQKIEVARTAVFRILQDAAQNGTPFGLVTFTETVRVPVPLGEIHKENLPYIENLISLLQPSGRSAIWDALAVGADLLRMGTDGVRGNIVLVTDGWDNASQRFDVRRDPTQPLGSGKIDLVPYVLPASSALTFRLIGIGSGDERDKGVDGAQMNGFISQLNQRAMLLGLATAFSFQAVTTGSALFAQMVHAFVDVGYDGDQLIEELHPEELARHAAGAARALKEPQQHATVSRIHNGTVPAAPPRANPDIEYREAPSLEVDVVAGTPASAPAYLRERYGPLGEVVEAYVNADYDRALDLLARSEAVLPPVTRYYWEARVQFARRSTIEAARALLQAWNEAERLPEPSQAMVVRRLALLQARMQNDKETEMLVKFIDNTEHGLNGSDPETKEKLMDLFAKLMELRGTYQLTRMAEEGDLQDAALKHEAAVEEVFGKLQDARLELGAGGPVVEGALDFIEICLAEMR